MVSDRGKPTILVLASTYPRFTDDPEPAFVHELCRRLVPRFNVVAIVPDAARADPSGDFDGVHVVRYRYAPRSWQTLVNDGGIAANLRRSRWKWCLVPGFIAMQYVSARRAIRGASVDVIHAHWLISPGIVGRLLANAWGIPLVVTSHGGDLFGFRGELFLRLKRWVARGAAAMTAVSAAMAREAARQALMARRMEVIPMGVDLDTRFNPDPSVARNASELLFVGRMVEKKGLRYLIAAMPLVLASRPDAHLRIIGFGPERESLEHQTHSLGLQAHVTFEGAKAQKDLPAFYRRAGLFVAPFVRDASGDQEGLPVALMEAVSTGCSFVVGNVAGLEDLLGNEAAPFIVDVVDSSSLAEAILLALDQPQSAAMAASAALAKARNHVDWARVVDRFAEVFDEVVREAIPQDG